MASMHNLSSGRRVRRVGPVEAHLWAVALPGLNDVSSQIQRPRQAGTLGLGRWSGGEVRQ
jgi:hypothetical protein